MIIKDQEHCHHGVEGESARIITPVSSRSVDCPFDEKIRCSRQHQDAIQSGLGIFDRHNGRVELRERRRSGTVSTRLQGLGLLVLTFGTGTGRGVQTFRPPCYSYFDKC